MNKPAAPSPKAKPAAASPVAPKKAAAAAEATLNAADSPEPPPPFFVLGCVRSGTTMLRDALRMHPNLACPEETHFFRWGEPYGTEAMSRSLSNNAVLKKHREI